MPEDSVTLRCKLCNLQTFFGLYNLIVNTSKRVLFLPPSDAYVRSFLYTGVGCHVLLQCMKVKSESEVAQSCPTLSDPMDCNLPGFSVHGICQARVLEWGAIAFSGCCSLVMSNSFVTPWTVLHQAPPSMGFSRQEYWSGLLFPSPRDCPNP